MIAKIATYCLLLAVLLAHQPAASAAGGGWLRGNGRARNARKRRCARTSHVYRPSQLETTWTANVAEWGRSKSYCALAARFQSNVTYWLQSTAALMATERPHLRDSQGDDVFSSFVSTFTCRDGSTHTRTAWIEPLAFALRHPAAPCNRTAIEDRSYLLLGSVTDYKPHATSRKRSQAACTSQAGPRAYLFDLGASTWSKGFGGPSQSFLITAYKDRGITFDRIFLWEAVPYTAKEIYEKVPRELHAVYQYINLPASTDPNDPASPFSILKQVAACEDFVAVKLDIDTPPLENELIRQILTDPEISSRIDEFYFEQHVNFQPMLLNWKTRIDKDKTLADSYALFLEMRKLGIRAHGWP